MGVHQKIKTRTLYDPAVPCLGTAPKEMNLEPQRNMYSPMCISALFITAKTWKQPRFPPAD